MHATELITIARPIFALLTLAAVGRQLVIHVESGFSVVNFFSYFTNLSNLLAATRTQPATAAWLCT